MIDTWGHLNFIEYGSLDPEDVDEIECRAIRIDLGMAELALALVTESVTNLELTKERELRIANSSVENVKQLMAQYECAGKRRSYRSLSEVGPGAAVTSVEELLQGFQIVRRLVHRCRAVPCQVTFIQVVRVRHSLSSDY